MAMIDMEEAFMERKRLIARGALIGVIVFVVTILLLLAGNRNREARWTRHKTQMADHVKELVEQYQGYLDETAKKITHLPVDPKVIGEIQVRHYRERSEAWLYVWASTNSGEFLFGVPSEAFAPLNAVFDQNRDAITRDNHYANRDQFLRTLLHDRRHIPLAETPDAMNRAGRSEEPDWWRFETGDPDSWEFARSNVFFLSTPIQNEDGTTVGNLYLKLIDVGGLPFYRSHAYFTGHDSYSDLEPLLVGPCVLAGLWLWFLLPSWVYIDASERDVPRPLLWAALTLVGTVFALMVYLLSRPTELKDLRCPRCSKVLNGSKAGCPYCGADLSTVFCPQCQYPLKPEWAFCPSCRGALSKTEVRGHNTEPR
jgi:gas vesicle protein